jgi:regulator of protease activity HflC (stomatin/prohibitin superfamily)
MTEKAGNSAVSSDSQAVSLIVQVNYSLDRGKAVDLYTETGGHYVERILDPAVFQYTKEDTAKYQAIQFAQNREKIRTEIEQKLSADVGKKGINIQNVTIKNVEFSRALTEAIEQTVEARQQAARAEAQVQIKRAEADQAIAVARGQAVAQKLRQKSLSPLYLQALALDNQRLAIEKLNENVRLIVCPPRTVCIPNSTVGTPGG